MAIKERQPLNGASEMETITIILQVLPPPPSSTASSIVATRSVVDIMPWNGKLVPCILAKRFHSDSWVRLAGMDLTIQLDIEDLFDEF